VLRLQTVEVSRTHDIRFLLESLEAAGTAIPDVVRAGEEMAPWAVEFRYGEPLDEELDRRAAVRIVADVLDWAASCFADR
jgi:hypothetical protein